MPPGRYQSQLFQFFQQQTRRLGDRISRGIREFKVAANWSFEAMLYPIFQIFQKIEKSSGKQLNSKTKSQQWKQPLLPHADNGINKTVSTAKALVLQEKSQNKLRLQLAKIRGIATDLSTRNLVLINNKNQVLDILSPTQQQMLQDLIVGHIAEYRQSLELSQLQKPIEIQPEIDRILAKLTGKSRENLSLDLSQDLPALPPPIDSQEIEPRFILNPYKAISLIDSTLAKIETKALPNLFKTAQLTQQKSINIVKITKNKFNIFLYGKDKTIVNEISHDKQIVFTNNILEDQKSKTQYLIEAAINYFFGNSAAKQILQSSSVDTRQKKLSETPPVKRLPQNQDTEIDPWLSVSDLFGEIEIINNDPALDNIPALPPTTAVKKSDKNKLSSYEEFLQPTKDKSNLVKSKKINSDITPSQKAKNPISIPSSANNYDENQDFSYQQEEEYIETKISKAEYEKHPLELLLEWLDSIMLELEELFLKVFRWLRKLWRNKR
jgi:hypothetical protein